MKKLSIIFFFLISVVFVKAQTGNTCITAIPFLNANSCIESNSLTLNEMWFSFTATDPEQFIELKKQTASIAFVNKVELFSNNCTSLILIDSDTLGSSDDSIL
jgi:hypothetical protein